MELLPEIIKLIQLNIPEILTFGLAVLSIILGKKYKKLKQIINELADLLTDLHLAIEDDVISPEEITKLTKDLKDLIESLFLR